MKSHRLIAGPLLIALAAWSHGAGAQDAQGDAGLPAPVRQNGATYLCGGVGSVAADAMRQAAGQYDLMVTFATKDGSFLADVDVAIVDSRGQPVVQAHCGGPIMLVSLPGGGRYTVRGTLSGQVESAEVQTGGARGRAVALTWPAAPAGG